MILEKILLLITVLAILLCLFGCASKPTSIGLMEASVAKCATVPELDGQRMYCQAFYVKEQCEYGALDLKICGKLEQ